MALAVEGLRAEARMLRWLSVLFWLGAVAACAKTGYRPLDRGAPVAARVGQRPP